MACPGSLVRQRFIYVSSSLPVIHHLVEPSEHPEESSDSLWAMIRAICQHRVQVLTVFTPAVQALGCSWKSMLTAAERNTALFFVARNLRSKIPRTPAPEAWLPTIPPGSPMGSDLGYAERLKAPCFSLKNYTLRAISLNWASKLKFESLVGRKLQLAEQWSPVWVFPTPPPVAPVSHGTHGNAGSWAPAQNH